MTGGVVNGLSRAGAPTAVMALDAGLLASYTGSGLWKNTVDNPADGAAKAFYDHYLGAATGGGADDPTFNGTPGNNSASEYFSGDGGDFFGCKGGQNTFTNSLHKNNAKFTWCAFLKTPASLSDGAAFMGTYGSGSSSVGVKLVLSGTNGALAFVVGNGSSEQVVATTGDNFVAAATNYLLGFSYNEALGMGMFYRNGLLKSTYNFEQAYTAPSSAASDAPLTLMAAGHLVSGYNPMSSGWRIWRNEIFNVALSDAQLTSIFNRYKSKLGL